MMAREERRRIASVLAARLPQGEQRFDYGSFMVFYRRPATPDWLRDRCYSVFGRECLVCQQYTPAIEVAHIDNWHAIRDWIRRQRPKLEQMRLRNPALVSDEFASTFHCLSNVVPLCQGSHLDYDRPSGFLTRDDLLHLKATALDQPRILMNAMAELERVIIGRRVLKSQPRSWMSRLGKLLVASAFAGDEVTLYNWVRRGYCKGLLPDVDPVVVIGRYHMDLSVPAYAPRFGTVGGDRPSTPRWWSGHFAPAPIQEAVS